MTTEKVSVKPISKKIEKELHQTKIVIRHLPPSFTEEKLLEVIEPLAPHGYFCFASGDPKLGKLGYSAAYLNFENDEDIFLFRDKFDGYPIVDGKGTSYRMIIEFASFQRCPRKKKRADAKCSTIEDAPEYKQFLVEYEKEPEVLPAIDPTLYAVKDMRSDSVQVTPLIKYLKLQHEKKLKHAKLKSVKALELRKERSAKGEKSKKGSDIVVSHKKGSTSGASKKEDDKLTKEFTENGKEEKVPKRRQHKYEGEATVRIIGKSRSETRGEGSGGRKPTTRDSKSDPTLAAADSSGSVTINGTAGKKIATQPTEYYYPSEGKRQQRKGRPDQTLFTPKSKSGDALDKDGATSNYRGSKYKNDYSYREGDRREERYYSQGGGGGRYSSSKGPRSQEEGRRTSDSREHT